MHYVKYKSERVGTSPRWEDFQRMDTQDVKLKDPIFISQLKTHSHDGDSHVRRGYERGGKRGGRGKVSAPVLEKTYLKGSDASHWVDGVIRSI